MSRESWWADRIDWFGPESFAGALCGLVCVASVPLGIAGGDAAWPYLGPLVGGGVLTAFRGPVRRFGTGLAISSVAVPSLLVGVLLLGGAAAALR
ncbi:hypothetical protein D092_04325 [Rhodococcus ruber Chol-4]|uniref:hypothetical protein n=1 Tax=Rhodococcus ruber TaxID=1830 RepID=UPI000381D506|nr:hypothetical protein [Rhodococcus ruber]KXF88273.1 hypothetical protein D092_04325 [Rhodococcus ruber Chol-4]QDC14023.1 hypothetical protein E2561_08075 [Rhodococcus ruber]RQM35028.1 hypothetical protein TN91_06680 [Rhodococcus ruber]